MSQQQLSFEVALTQIDGQKTSKIIKFASPEEMTLTNLRAQLNVQADQILLFRNPELNAEQILDENLKEMRNNAQLRVLKRATLKGVEQEPRKARKSFSGASVAERMFIEETAKNTEVIGFLKVDVLEARNLPKMDLNGILIFFETTSQENVTLL